MASTSRSDADPLLWSGSPDRPSADRARRPVAPDVAADAAVVIQAPDGRMSEILVDPAGSVFGWTPDELLGGAAAQFVHPEDREVVADLRVLTQRTGEANVAEFRVRAKSGRWVWVECTWMPVCNEHGVPTGATSASLRDVSAKYMDHEALAILNDVRELVRGAGTAEVAWREGLGALRRLAGFELAALVSLDEPDATVQLIEVDPVLDDGAATGSVDWRLVERWLGTARTAGHPGPSVHRLPRELLAALDARSAMVLALPDDAGRVTQLAALLTVRRGASRSGLRLAELLLPQVADVVGRRDVELARVRAETEFRLSFEEAAIGMALVAPDGTFLRVNDALAQLLGRPQSELLGLGFQEVTHPDDLVLDEDQVAAALRGEIRSYQLEKRYLRADGTVVWALLSVSLVRDEHGEPVHFISQIQDITGRHDAERALGESNARFRAAFDDSAIGMAVVDVGPTRFGRILEVNEAMAAMTGIERAELDGADICSFFRVTDAAEVRAQLQELVDGRSEVVRFDHPLRSDGQDETWVRLTAAPVAAEPERDACAVVQMEDVSRQRAAQARLSHLALHDSLTGLPNRSLALERVRHAQLRSQRSGAHVGVLFVDLDRFKVVNDSLGHDVGDRLLQAVASRFTSVLRPGDTVARLGGDEFLIVCEDLSADEPCAAAELRSVAGRLHGAIAEPIRLGDHVVPVTASVGLALGTGSGEGVESLVSNADTAMYEAKQQGRARSEAFDQHLRTRAVERLRTERDLRDALASDQLWMAYQPLVELASGRVAGAEALLRWDHPVRGPVPPGDFIDVAEDSGLIVEVGQLVVSEVCRDVARHPGWDGLRIAVNLSARQLSQSDFAQTVRSCLEREGLPPQRLAIELTENVLMEAGGSALRQLEELHAHGIAVGIDDFGTGYASLTYLRRLPVSFVKIDRSFVARLGRDREDASIVEAVVRLCEAMDVSVVAEGIETVEQLAVLQALGCTLGQGFLFGRPVRPDELPLADLLHTPTG